MARIREAAGANGSGPPLIYAGRLQREKCLDLLLQAIACLGVESDGPVLTIIGDGPDRQRLETVASDLDLSDRVEFRGRLADSDDVWRTLGRSRVAVQPSEREGFGLFPLEAMAAGLPVVYVDSPESAVSEVVGDGIGGLASPADATTLASILTTLLNDRDEWERLAAGARRRAAAFDWTAVCDRLETALYEVTASSIDTSWAPAKEERQQAGGVES